MSAPIYHLTSKTAWQAAQKAGRYLAGTLAGEGFIHCSKADQILRVADKFYRNQPGLVLLVIDPTHLNSELRWEPGADYATELFPHIYGLINLDAVVKVLDFEPGADGKFALPKTLEGISTVR